MKNKIFFILIIFPISLSAKAIIFDIFGVLFNIPIHKQILHMGFQPLKYALDKKNPAKFKNIFLDLLSKVKIDEHLLKNKLGAMASDKPMPDVMFAWQSGNLNYKDAISAIKKFDQYKFSSNRESKMFDLAVSAAFDFETRKKLFTPMVDGIELLKRCAQDGHKIFILSNMDREMMDFLCQNYPDVFNLCTGIVISEDTKTLKPDPNIYRYLLQKYNLNPDDCIFIDDQQENTSTAQNLGINSFLCSSPSKVAKKLEKTNIISRKPKTYNKQILITSCIALTIAYMSFLK